MRLILPLFDPEQAKTALSYAYRQARPHLVAGQRLQIEVRPETRSDAENRMLHALLSQIAATTEWAGKKRDIEVWKRLLTAAWLRARGESIEVLPALDGHGIDVVFRRTSGLTRGECAELIDYVQAWMAQNGVGERIDQETGEVMA